MSASVAFHLEALAERFSKAAQDLRSGNLSLENDTTQRMDLLKAGSDLIDIVGLPKDKALFWLPQCAHITAIRLFIKWKAFEAIPLNDDAAISESDLAAKLGANLSLITRVSRVLVANNTLRRVGTDSLAHTDFSKIFTTANPIREMTQIGFDSQLKSWVSMPEYFDRFGIADEPTDRLQTVMAFAHGRLGSNVWDVWHSSEERLQAFMLAMGAIEEQMPSLGIYDLSWAAAEATKSPDRVLVVDVGGGRGQALKGILRATPGIPAGRCVLGDLPEVVEATKREVPELAEVKMVATDFFKEQPVKGALVYYIRRCLHDYSDEECVKILQHISDAMAADSRLLIVETLLGDKPSAFQAAMDLSMLAISGKERTLAGFQEITGKAALKITKVSQNPEGSAVIECTRV
ncbi:O-methyltransferase-domain-containing protein [Dichotomopilus funicola]|uniref:O-methyltransferase-domain-containing protein n=1 Tax=Dichotomopilus funicola TaxID=1934379 RepID=A0AAN6UXY0_9PEZI|nr:O-methyltransferase-domain-containing protein [Dichotomopilus funicola]